ncbi:MAG: M23 family metallopeptidase [Anaerolineaceae bacterium]|nr:M23 family metallopeptidase [Anaerolineaceae bacterium]
MRKKYAVIILFILLWGSVLSGCKTDIENQLKLNENVESTSFLTTELGQNHSTPKITQKTPTLHPDPRTSSVEKDEPTFTNDTSSSIETELISPLEGIKLEELTEIVSNPFSYAGDGKDDGHHGTDFSFYQYKSFEKIENLPVLSITSGRVSSVIHNRPPYGNMVMVETPLSSLPDFLRNHLLHFLPESEIPFQTNLSCPAFQSEENSQISDPFSLYILYAHLYSPRELRIDSLVLSGNPIGAVGNSGSSGNPHLHLEFRIGPSDHSFEEMAHYDNTASQNEISNYCLWRVSGLFYQVDPMEIIKYYLQNR